MCCAIRAGQVLDDNFLSEDEARAGWKDIDIGEEHGFTDAFPATITNVDSGTKTITLEGGSRLQNGWQAQKGDIVEIVGGDAQGDYTIDEVLSQTEMSVVESIPNASSGDVTIYHPPGADQIGVDRRELDEIEGNTVQENLESLEGLLGGEGITEEAHEDLNTLTHNLAENAHIDYTRQRHQITNVTWWTDNQKTQKIREADIDYERHIPTEQTVIQYDGDGNEIYRLVYTYEFDGLQVNTVDVQRIES